jgi:parvulin-like peptidyl-prolyl isomerase/tetratricopeptide (TPR) repeat protein
VNITIWAVIIGFSLGGIIFFTPGGLQIFNPNPPPEEEPAIIVNGEEIPRSELEFAFQSLIQRYRQLYEQIGSDFDEQLRGASGAYYQLQLRSQAADELIRRALLKQEARKRGISVPRTQVDLKFREQYEQFLRTNNVTEEELLEFLRDPQIRERFRQFFNLPTGTLAEFKRKLRSEVEEQLKQEVLKEQIVGQIEPTDLELLDFVEENKTRYLTRIIAPIVPTEEELQAYFEENREKYVKEEVRVSHILIKVAQDAPEEDVQSASRKIQELRAQLEAGADFAELARKHSQDPLTREEGGKLGYFERGRSPYGEEFEEAAFALEEGEISDPVRTDAGFHLIQLLERQTLKFEDVMEQVEFDFVEEERERLFTAWLKEAREKGVFPPQEEIHARHILIEVPEDAPEEEVQSASRKIEEIKAELEAGADFAELAEKHSDDPGTRNVGGDLGWFGRGRMVPEFEKVAFELSENEISDPVRTQFGFHIIQLLERRTTEALKDEVQSAYISEETRERFEEWVKGITEAAEIEVKEPLLAAYRVEERARESEDPEEKLKLLDEAIAAYEKAEQELVADPYIGYYQSRLYLEKLAILEEQLEGLGEEASDEERSALEEQIEQQRRLAAESFLKSTYEARDAAVFERMVETDPDNPELRYYYARFLIEHKNDDSQAYEELKKAVEADPKYWRAQVLAADIQMRRGLYASAIEHLEQALGLVSEGSRPSQEIRLKLGRAYLEQSRKIDREENLGEAEQVLTELRDELEEADRRLAEVLELLGDLYMERQEYQKAQEAYRASLKAANRTAVEVKLGRAYLADGKLDEAESTFQSVLARYIYSEEAHLGLGDVYKARGEREKALESYRQALDLSTDYESREEAALRILELDPQDLRTRFRLAALYLDERIYSSTIEQYQAILELDPESWQAQKGLGEAYMGLAEYEQAKDHFHSALLLGPPNHEQIRIYEEILEAEEIIVGFGNPLGEDGQEALFKLAELYFKQGREDKAKEQLEKLKSDYPDYRPEEVSRLLAQIEGQEEKAEEDQEEDGP